MVPVIVTLSQSAFGFSSRNTKKSLKRLVGLFIKPGVDSSSYLYPGVALNLYKSLSNISRGANSCVVDIDIVSTNKENTVPQPTHPEPQ